MIRNDRILWPELQGSMTREAATTNFYDLDDRFLWTGQQVSMTKTLEFEIWIQVLSLVKDFLDTDDKFIWLEW
jgi:hypothetical protein